MICWKKKARKMRPLIDLTYWKKKSPLSLLCQQRRNGRQSSKVVRRKRKQTVPAKVGTNKIGGYRCSKMDPPRKKRYNEQRESLIPGTNDQ